MEPEAKSILTQAGLPAHVALLLELYGIRTISDLASLDSTILEDVENCVKNGTFEAIVDLEDKPTRLQYLGFDYKSLASFKFQPMDMRKLLKVPGLAQEELNKLSEAIEKLTSPVRQKKVASPVVKTSKSPDEKPEKVTRPKRNIKKESTSEAAIVVEIVAQEQDISQPIKDESEVKSVIITDFSRKETITKKLITHVSSFMKSVNLEQHLDLANFHVDFIKKGSSLTANIACPLCNKPIALCFSKYISPSMYNFKRHINLVHLKGEKKSKIKVEVVEDNNVVFEYEALDEAEIEQKPSVKVLKRKRRSRKSDKIDKDAGLIYKIVDGVKLYECDICGKGNITDRYKLNNHRQIHTSIRNFVCEICMHTFKTKEALRGHSKLHEEVYLYCDICDARFKVRHQLRCHMDAIHLGKRDHTCHLCGKSFSRVGTLRVHIKGHVEEKKVQCEYCGFKAMNNGKMLRHMKSHTGERNCKLLLTIIY